jgi:hypothetical protein
MKIFTSLRLRDERYSIIEQRETFGTSGIISQNGSRSFDLL